MMILKETYIYMIINVLNFTRYSFFFKYIFIIICYDCKWTSLHLCYILNNEHRIFEDITLKMLAIVYSVL